MMKPLMEGALRPFLFMGLLLAGPAEPSQDDALVRAQKLAERVAAIIKADGIEGARTVLERSEHNFRDGDLYAWVLDSHGVVVLHPDPIMIGLDLIMLRDMTARVFIAEILLRAHSKQRFWDEYTGVKPDTNRVTVKRQWIIKVDDHIVGAGAWLDL